MVTSWDILFFWVARMMMMGLKFMGDVPFREVYIHSLVADAEGKKMSKSRGNVVDPLELVAKYGTDALRFTLASIETKQRYVALTPTKLESSRNFVNKLYNAVRFIRMAAADGKTPMPRSFRDDPSLALEDRWILTRLGEVAASVTSDYGKYRVAELSVTLYQFLWHEVCDWYLEALKPRLYAEDPAGRGEGRAKREKAAELAVTVLESILRLLHPQMPFVTEELWQKLPHEGDTIQKCGWPDPGEYPSDPKAVEEFRFLQEAVTAIRTSRSESNIPPAAKVRVSVKGGPGSYERLKPRVDLLNILARVGELQSVDQRPANTSGSNLAGGEVYVHLEGLVDIAKERARQEKEMAKLRHYVQTLQARLDDPGFVKKAPSTLLEAEKQKISDAHNRLERLENNLQYLA
jgi:valyl-tRNA synthetase